MEKRSPGFFKPFSGRVVQGTVENISKAEEKTLKVNFPFLQKAQSVKVPAITVDHSYCVARKHPVTGSDEHYCLTDEFHKKNVKTKVDKLRECNLVHELCGLVNTQVQEQLFRKTVRDLYFLNMMSPGNYLFLLRLILHLQNNEKNKSTEADLVKKCQAVIGDCHCKTDLFGRICVGGTCNSVADGIT